MSKKLLFNNYTVNGLLPVQDGLVCWLDAFDLNSYNVGETWNDRTNYRNNGVITAIFKSTSIGNGVLNTQSIVDIPNPTKNLDSYSVEIGYEDTTKKYWLGLWGNRSGNKGLSFYQTGNTFNSYPGINASLPQKNGISGGKNYVTFTFGPSFLKIYHNGELYLNMTNNPFSPTTANYLCFMGRKGNSVNDDTTGGADHQICNWYYIRIYNKALTEEEILINYNYELSLKRG